MTDRQPGTPEIPQELIEQWRAEALTLFPVQLQREFDEYDFVGQFDSNDGEKVGYLAGRKAAYLESITRTAGEFYRGVSAAKSSSGVSVGYKDGHHTYEVTFEDFAIQHKYENPQPDGAK